MRYIPKFQNPSGKLPTYKGKPTTADKVGNYLKRSSQYIAESLPQFGMNIPFDALRDLGVKIPVTMVSPTGYQGSYGTNQTTKQFTKHLLNNAGETAAIDMGFGLLSKGVQVAAPYVKQGVKNTGNYLLKKSEPYLLGDKRIPMMSGYKLKQEFWNPFSKEIKNNFESEINWGKWNKEIPQNNQLMKEYNAIEQTAKANGTWMKNPDGSSFKGTPEQFVQQNSNNFKKAFPSGYSLTYRGDRTHYPELDYNPVFTGDKQMALNYTQDNASYWTPNHPFKARSKSSDPTSGGLYELYYNPDRIKIKIDAKNNDYTRLKLDEIAGDDYVSTDDIARRIASGHRDAEINNVYDASVYPGTVRIINHNLGSNNFMKSARGNNGMFDMTNPNIYKAVVPAAGLYGLTQYKKQGGRLIPKAQAGLKWNQRLYNAIDPTLPEIDVPTVAGAGIATALGLNLRNKNKYPVEEAAWKKRLNLPYNKKYLPSNPNGSVRLPDNVASQIVVDTNFVKNRIANQRNQQKYYTETRGYESKALNDMLKVDQAHLDSLRKFYNTGKSVGLNEFGAWKDRDVIDPETGKYKENVVSPLNVLHNFTLYKNPKTKKPMYGDIYDFNWADVLVPGKPYEISGPVK